MRRTATLLAVGLALWSWTGGAHAADDSRPRAHTLQLRSGAVDTAQTLQLKAEPQGGAGRYVIQLDGPLTRVRRAQLERAGIRLGDYLPDHAYVVRVAASEAATLATLPGVRWVERFRPEWKLAPDIGTRVGAANRAEGGLARGAGEPDPGEAVVAARRSLAAAGRVKVVISVFADADLDAVAADLARVNGVQMLSVQRTGARSLIDAVVPLAALNAVAALDAVQFVEEAPVGTLRNTTTRWVIQSNINGQTPLWNAGLHGEGQIAGLIDGEVWQGSCYFSDSVPPGPAHRKLVGYHATAGANSHGTHTAGTLVGDQAPWGAPDVADGMAFAAKLSYSSYWNVSANPSLLYPYLVTAHTDGARVHSNSWGDDTTTAYTTWCEQADRYARDYEDDLVVFSATNYATLKTPENAKNVLAVGATYQAPSQDSKAYGGSGPTADGRRKPEVFAPGAGIVSASYYLTCGTYTSSGTSMASPAVAGMAVLTRQYYMDGYYPSGQATPADAFTPSGALLKATVINSAVDMTNVAGYPSDTEGWGRLLMDRALYFAGDARTLFVADVRNAAGLSTGEFETYHVEVTNTAEPLKVTLVFTDAPGTVNASQPVVNDVDLIVTGPRTAASGGLAYRGNYFAAGQSAAGGVRDALNNVEQVHLTAPELGVYTIEVNGAAINQDTQGYALVVTGGLSVAAPLLGTGDYDYDGDVDLLDFASFQQCFTGTGNGPLHAACEQGDFDGDRDVDDADTAAFVAALTVS
jgi:hypothetical protein